MKKKILVVDDNFLIRELLKVRLSKRGFEVETASNEKEFWSGIFASRPDLIILDVWLKDKSGPYIYERLSRFFGFNPVIPVIFITAFIDKKTLPREHRLDETHTVFTKPFNFEELCGEIDRLLKTDSADPGSLLLV